MQSVKVKTVELAHKLQENRIVHEREYKESVVAYRTLVVQTCENALALFTDQLAIAKEGKDVSFDDVPELPQAPREYLKNYDRAIAMCAATVDTELVLPVQDFDRFWLDEWEWSHSFKGTSDSYRAMSASNDVNATRR